MATAWPSSPTARSWWRATGYDGSYDFAVVRYNPDGSLDASFDGDGKVTTDSELGATWAYSVALQSDGKIVVAGTEQQR